MNQVQYVNTRSFDVKFGTRNYCFSWKLTSFLFIHLLITDSNKERYNSVFSFTLDDHHVPRLERELLICVLTYFADRYKFKHIRLNGTVSEWGRKFNVQIQKNEFVSTTFQPRRKISRVAYSTIILYRY